MTTEQLAIIVPGAIAILLAGLNIWYQHWLTNRTLEQQADLTQQTLDHQRTLAREQRVKEQRFGIYLELLTALRRLEMGLIRTAPLFGPALEPPPPLSDEEVWHLSAIADVGASEEVSNLLEAWLRKLPEFYAAAQDFELRHERGELDSIRAMQLHELRHILEQVRSEL